MSENNNTSEGYEREYGILNEDKPSLGLRSSGGSIMSAQEDPETKKKFMQGFDEVKDSAHMICKRIRKNLKLTNDDFENIKDLHAYSVMFTPHKVSKFGQKSQKQMSSKMALYKSEVQ